MLLPGRFVVEGVDEEERAQLVSVKPQQLALIVEAWLGGGARAGGERSDGAKGFGGLPTHIRWGSARQRAVCLVGHRDVVGPVP